MIWNEFNSAMFSVTRSAAISGEYNISWIPRDFIVPWIIVALWRNEPTSKGFKGLEFATIGVNGMNGLAKVMGFLILCIGIQFVVNGITAIATDPTFLHAIRDALQTS